MSNVYNGTQTHHSLNKENCNHADDIDKEPEVKESVLWISNEDDHFPFTLDEMKTWIVEGPRKNEIKDETEFCDPNILQQILKAKDIFDTYGVKPLIRARYRANAFETIGSVFFMNRAALKMANIDAATGFMFTKIDENLDHKRDNAPYYFADVCAGPGGFTEYLLWRKKWTFKGFGFTLKDDNDFEIKKSKYISASTFNGLYGKDGDGDIFKIQNIQDFVKKVKHETEGLGVHFMMSDGGFSVQGEENLQEVLSKQLYICQCLMALEVVRPNGHFVTKLFDLFTSFSVGLIYFMYKCFKKIAILKPNTSRPANAERYLICSELRNNEQTELIRTYLSEVAIRLQKLRKTGDGNHTDVNEIIMLNVLKEDKDFYEYIKQSNNKIGYSQIRGLKNMEKYYRKPELKYPKQEELRLKCLEYWNIPSHLQKFEFTFEDLTERNIYKEKEFMNDPGNTLDDLKKCLTNVEDWYYVHSGCTQKTNICNFYIALSDTMVYRLQQLKWVRVQKLTLSAGTLLYGEMIREKVKVIANKEKIKLSLHVIDAIQLGDKYIAELPFTERLNNITTYCQAVNHESRTNQVRVRPKYADNLSKLTQSLLNENNFYILPTLGYDSIQECYEVNSILFLNAKQELLFNQTFTTRIQVFLSKTEECKNDENASKVMLHQLIETIYKYAKNAFK